jgi:hypothetical protein
VSNKSVLFIIPFLLCSFFAIAQNISLNGKIINAKNEPIPGATISIPEMPRYLAADVEGRFSIALAPGKKYSITFSAAGYDSKLVEEVEVKAGDDNNITVVLQNKTLGEVVVKSSVRRESTNALINLQRNNSSVSSGLAADFIKRTPDRNTGEVLKRVSGTSIQDNKFVIVRGLGDRYNTAYINGAQLPSSEPDKKAFSFDVIPANVIDNIIINKTATPDLTGEFAGGLIQVTTKDVPNKNFLTVGANIGFNTQSTGKDFYSNERNNTDWLGFDDGTRKLPTGFPATRQAYNSLSVKADGLNQQLELTKLFRNDVYAQKKYTAAPIQTYNLAWGLGKRYKNGHSFGTVVSLIYRKGMQLYDVERALYDNNGESALAFVDKQNKYSVNVGAMANFSYVAGKHKISFKNLVNQYYEDNYYFRSGSNNERGGEVNLWSSVLNQRTFYTGIFEGNHQLNFKNIKVYWNAGYSLNDKKQPDLRTSAYFKSGIGSGNPFVWDQDDTRRFYSNLQDHGLSGTIAVTMPFTAFGHNQSVKIGGSTLMRFRDFKSRIFRYVEASNANFDDDYNTLPFDQIFAPEHIATNGFVMEEFTNNEDKYFAVSALNAGYLMFDNKLSDAWRVIWGARVEFFEQFLRTKDRSAKQIVINPEQWRVLPSVNISYDVNDRNKIRLSAAQTVSRPEFREIAPFQFFDYESTFGVRGNTDLKTTNIYNLDARYEIYPGAGEAITVGAFYKRFENPIEFRLSPESVPTRRNYFYQNAKDANTYGAELEIRKNLNFLGGSETSIFSNFSVFGNFTYIFSQVRFDDEASGKVASADRPVQGQSPYLINAGLQYTSDKSGISSTLLYNRVGSRLALVGYSITGFPDIYEKARHVIDFQIAKRVIKKRGEIKLSYGDILNQKLMYFENLDKSKSYKEGTDRIFSSYKPGSTITLGFTYDFSL